jgi:hypothetical protein
MVREERIIVVGFLVVIIEMVVVFVWLLHLLSTCTYTFFEL